jgi:hypothetical protein
MEELLAIGNQPAQDKASSSGFPCLGMQIMKWLPFILLLIIGATVSRAEELRLTATEAFSKGTTSHVRLSPDGSSLEMIRGILLENDGPAAGYSYKPNEEILNEGITAYIDLRLDQFPRVFNKPIEPRAIQPPARAFLLVGHTGKLLDAIINGERTELPAPIAVGNYWKQYEIPTNALTKEWNEIGVRGEGKLWIARDDERPRRTEPAAKEPLSYKVTPESGSNRLRVLGPKNDIKGEYYIRVYIDGFRRNAAFNTIIYDAANLSGDSIPPPNVKVKRVRVRLEGDEADGRLNAGVSFQPENEPVGSLKTFPPFGADKEVVMDDIPGDSPVPRYQPPRYFAATALWYPGTFERTPKLTGIHLQTEIESDKGWGDKLQIIAKYNPDLRWTQRSFQFEELDHPKLAQFRRDYHLDDVVKGCRTDLERMEKLAVWTSQQWTKGHLKEIYPKWDACEILKKHQDGTPIGGFCQQYNIVFLQACEAFGMPGRCVSIGAGDHGVKIRSGHEVVEIWSNELNKWVYVDGQAAWYFVDKETREPLNLLELRERQLATLLDKSLREESKRPVDVVVLAPSPYEWKGLEGWPAFTELRMIPHTQFLDGKLPLPLNQGMRGWFWTGHHVWTDDLYPASVLYSHRIASPLDWNFPINQTHIWLQQNVKVGVIDVRLENNMPSFAKYEIQIDDQPPRLEKAAEFQWPLHAGENRLQVRAVNQLGLKGPPSWFNVEFK